MEITVEEKKSLLKFARDSIESIFSKQPIDLPETTPESVFNSKAGAFVTLTINSMLRGCIGYIISDSPLINTVRDAAIQAATGDPRFPSLTEPDFEQINIELSILSEPFPMKSYEEIEIGKHGLILEEEGRRALLLPQVPIEHKMNRDEFLSALCEKAGLYSDYWSEKTLKINLFTATVFSEKEMED